MTFAFVPIFSNIRRDVWMSIEICIIYSFRSYAGHSYTHHPCGCEAIIEIASKQTERFRRITVLISIKHSIGDETVSATQNYSGLPAESPPQWRNWVSEYFASISTCIVRKFFSWDSICNPFFFQHIYPLYCRNNLIINHMHKC